MIEMRKSYLNEANEIHKKEKDEITESFEKDKKELIIYFENQIEKLELKHSQEIVALKNRIDSLEKLLNGEKKEELSNKNKGKRIIECKFDDELCGIISYMKKTFGDVLKFSDAGTSSATPTVNLFSYDTNNINEIYENQTSGVTIESNGWVEVDFGEQKVSLESYTIRSGDSSAYYYSHPKSWRISGSNDRSHWEIISHMVNCSLLNGPYKQHRFECENSQKFYRYIRYIQEDSWSKDYKFNIRLTCLELFGSILD